MPVTIVYLDVPAGPVIAGWALGLDDETMEYGADSALVKTLQVLPRTVQARNKLMDMVKSGKTNVSEDASYAAGDFGMTNLNTLRDARTYLHWDTSSSQDQTLAALGSYNLKVTATNVGPDGATLIFEGSNTTSLGSAGSVAKGARELFGSLTPSNGPLSDTTQKFSWAETITW